jgi:adenine-specific DNA methylase
MDSVAFCLRKPLVRSLKDRWGQVGCSPALSVVVKDPPYEDQISLAP